MKVRDKNKFIQIYDCLNLSLAFCMSYNNEEERSVLNEKE